MSGIAFSDLRCWPPTGRDGDPCSEHHPSAEDDEPVTCPTCRERHGLDPLDEDGEPVPLCFHCRAGRRTNGRACSCDAEYERGRDR